MSGGGYFNPTAIASDSWNEGKAGDISLNVSDELTVREHARISVNSRNSGGGIIGINAGNSIYLLESEIPEIRFICWKAKSAAMSDRVKAKAEIFRQIRNPLF